MHTQRNQKQQYYIYSDKKGVDVEKSDWLSAGLSKNEDPNLVHKCIMVFQNGKTSLSSAEYKIVDTVK